MRIRLWIVAFCLCPLLDVRAQEPKILDEPLSKIHERSDAVLRAMDQERDPKKLAELEDERLFLLSLESRAQSKEYLAQLGERIQEQEKVVRNVQSSDQSFDDGRISEHFKEEQAKMSELLAEQVRAAGQVYEDAFWVAERMQSSVVEQKYGIKYDLPDESREWDWRARYLGMEAADTVERAQSESSNWNTLVAKGGTIYFGDVHSPEPLADPHEITRIMHMIGYEGLLDKGPTNMTELYEAGGSVGGSQLAALAWALNHEIEQGLINPDDPFPYNGPNDRFTMRDLADWATPLAHAIEVESTLHDSITIWEEPAAAGIDKMSLEDAEKLKELLNAAMKYNISAYTGDTAALLHEALDQRLEDIRAEAQYQDQLASAESYLRGITSGVSYEDLMNTNVDLDEVFHQPEALDRATMAIEAIREGNLTQDQLREQLDKIGYAAFLQEKLGGEAQVYLTNILTDVLFNKLEAGDEEKRALFQQLREGWADQFKEQIREAEAERDAQEQWDEFARYFGTGGTEQTGGTGFEGEVSAPGTQDWYGQDVVQVGDFGGFLDGLPTEAWPQDGGSDEVTVNGNASITPGGGLDRWNLPFGTVDFDGRQFDSGLVRLLYPPWDPAWLTLPTNGSNADVILRGSGAEFYSGDTWRVTDPSVEIQGDGTHTDPAATIFLFE